MLQQQQPPVIMAQVIPSSEKPEVGESGENEKRDAAGGESGKEGLSGECDTSTTKLLGGGKVLSPGSKDHHHDNPEMTRDCPVVANCDGYDSDCLVIVEDAVLANKDDHNNVTSTSQSPMSASIVCQTPEVDCTMKGEAYDIKSHTLETLHSLPIHDLKRKLAFCSVCHTQYQNHKQANLCLSKHGKRQCWLCLEVMPNTKDSYFQHCQRNHAIGQSNDIVGCPYCQKFFDFRQGFNQHIVKVHFSEDVSYVSTTACLSPKSLVDIFTGQPRGKELQDLQEQSDREENLLNANTNEVSTTTTTNLSHNLSDNPFARMTPSTNSSQGEAFLKTARVQITQPSPTDPQNDSISTATSNTHTRVSIKDISKLQEPEFICRNPPRIGFGMDGSHSHKRSALGVTRESVIRQTPQCNLTSIIRTDDDMPEIPSFLHFQQIQPPQASGVELREQGDISTSKSFHFYGRSNKMYQQKIPSAGAAASTYPPNSPQLLSQNPNQSQLAIVSPNPGSNNRSSLTYDFDRMENVRSDTPDVRSRHWNDHQYYQRRNQYGQGQIDPATQFNYRRPNSEWSYRGASFLDGTPHGILQQQLSPSSMDSTCPQPPSSPCLMEMAKLVHTTPVHLQYFNSVNSMLRTVAECNPAASFSPTPLSSSSSSYPPSSTSHHLQLAPNYSDFKPPATPSMMSPTDTMTNSRQHPVVERRSSSSDSDTFKVPCNGGVKRRILTKWDGHHQEPKSGLVDVGGGKVVYSSVVPSPTTPGMEFAHLLDQSQVEIRTDLNPMNYNQNRRRNAMGEDANFWEQILKESNSMHRSQGSMVHIYDNAMTGPNFEALGGGGEVQLRGGATLTPYSHLHQQYQQPPMAEVSVTHVVGGGGGNDGGQKPRPTTTTQTNYQNTTYPRIMARVDPSGRPVGIFTADGQPCLVSAYEQEQPQLLTACDVTTPNTCVTELAESHLQYQHRIIRQISTEGSRNRQQPGFLPQQQQQPNMSLRRRKSSIPVRILPTDSDSVVVQNPFEEEDSSSNSKRSQIQAGGDFAKIAAKLCHGPIVHPTSRDSFGQHTTLTNIHHQFHSAQSYHVQQRFIGKAGHFMNCQPKFTSGGRITDFSGRNPCSTGKGSGAKNFNVESNFANRSTPTPSSSIGSGSSNIEMQHQIDAEYHGNERRPGVSTTGPGSTNWPPFAVCQRYYETTQNIRTRLKNLNKQRKGHRPSE